MSRHDWPDSDWGRWLSARATSPRALDEGTRWRAVEPRTGRPLRIRRATGLAPQLDERGRIVRDTVHPHLAPLVEWAQFNGHWVTIDAAVGEDLRDVLRQRRLTVIETVSLGLQLLAALEHLHELPLLHGELAPGNVVIDQAFHVRLVAPGMAAEEAMGYMSPEQTGVVRAPLSTASDLYSLGALLYACLSGSPPYAGATSRRFLQQQAAGTLEPLAAEVPGALRTIVHRLLAREARHRYPSAATVRDDLEALDAALRSGDADPHLAIASDRLLPPRFVGRQIELDRLLQNPGLALVESDSGGGKTRLLEEFAQALPRTTLILTARGTQAEARRPFDLLTQLLQSARDQGQTVEVPDEDREALHALSGRPSSIAGTGVVVGAMRRLLPAMARDFVILLDDAQWADDATLELLEREAADPIARHTVVAFRSVPSTPRETHAVAMLSGLDARVRMTLSPLTADEAWAVATSMAGDLPPTVADLLTQAEGNVFVVIELMRGLVESGALAFEDRQWRLRSGASGQASQASTAVLMGRLERLAPTIREALQACAVLGRSFDTTVAGGFDVDPALLEQARRQFLVWPEIGGRRFSFVHDRIRERLLLDLPVPRRQALHRRAADLVEAASFDIAYHLGEAGDFAAALPHALRAAEDARHRCSFEVAEENFRLAARGLEGLDHPLHFRVNAGLAAVLLTRGAYEESEALWQSLHTPDRSDAERALIEGSLAAALTRRGRSGEGLERIWAGLRALGHRVPNGPMQLVLETARQVAIQTLHSLFPHRYRARLPLPDTVELEASSLILEMLAQTSRSHDAVGPFMVWAVVTDLNRLEQFPDTEALGTAFAQHAAMLVFIPWFSRARRFIERALSLPVTRRDRLLQLKVLSRQSFVEYCTGDLRAALRAALRGRMLADDRTDMWETDAVGSFLGRSAFLCGYAAQGAGISYAVWTNMQRGGDPVVCATSLGEWAMAQGGAFDHAELDSLDAIGGAPAGQQQHAHAFWLLGHGEPRKAATWFERAGRVTTEMPVHLVSRMCWCATAWRMALQTTPPGAGRARRQALKAWRRAVRRALNAVWRAPLHRPHALCEAAILAAEEGRERKARTFFARALKIAVEQENIYHFALILFERGRTGRDLDWPDADSNLADARWAFRCMGLDPEPLERFRLPTLASHATPAMALADRFHALRDVARMIVTRRSAEEVLNAVRDGLRDLLRAQRCESIDPGEGPTTVEIGQTEGVRSILYAPLSFEERPYACFVASHAELEGYFAEEERLLARFVVTLGEVALEAAARFSAARQLTESLQQSQAVLRQTLADREALLAEVQERVKKDLDLVEVLLEPPTGEDETMLDLRNRVRSMALLHEQVQAPPQSQPSGVRLDIYIRTLVGHLVHAHGTDRRHIGVTLHGEPVQVDFSHAVDWGLITNELLSNAIQHAFDEAGGQVTIRLDNADGHPRLEVEDNGIGMPAHLPPTTLGLMLVDLLSERLGVRVLRPPHAGTKVVVTRESPGVRDAW